MLIGSLLLIAGKLPGPFGNGIPNHMHPQTGALLMSPDELLWNAPAFGGLEAEQWNLVVDYLFRQLVIFLRIEPARDEDASISNARSFGFSVDFWSLSPATGPLELNVRGTFGAAVHDNLYMSVQGCLYPYLQGKRLATTTTAHNHIYLRDSKVDATDYDWELTGCSGSSGWRSCGWSPGTYGAFEGFELWQDLSANS